MILLFDTETSGLPKNYKASVTNTLNWPRLVQLAYILQDFEGNTIKSNSYIIKPVGFIIDESSSRIHGITHEKALKEGVDLNQVLLEFKAVLDQISVLVAHNISFDEKIIGCEFYRKNIKSKLDEVHKICTMKSSTDFCQIEGSYGYKWPTLAELHQKLFNTNFTGAHSATIDVSITAKCLNELIKKRIINIPQNIKNVSEVEDILTNEKPKNLTNTEIPLELELENYFADKNFPIEFSRALKLESLYKFMDKICSTPVTFNILDYLKYLSNQDMSLPPFRGLNATEQDFVDDLKEEILNTSFKASLNTSNEAIKEYISSDELRSFVDNELRFKLIYDWYNVNMAKYMLYLKYHKII